MDILERGPLIPMETVLTIGPGSPYYMGDQTKTYLFYAQSWAATHFLTFGPGMQQGEKLRQFFNLLQQGVEQKKAFVQVFGDFPGVDKGLLKYVGQWAFTAAEVPAQGEIEDKEFAIRKMTAAEFEAELAAFHILSHRWKEMKELTEAALKDDPRLGLAHEDMGYFQFNEGKNEEALREFSQAVELDNTLYRSLFAKTMLSPEANSDGPTDQKKFHDELLNVLSLVPQYAPAFLELAKLNLRQGNYAQALALSRKAEQLEPWRAGYHLLSGQILLRMGRNNEAASYAAFVANRWASVDHDEAMELWNRVPPDQRPKEALQESETEKKEKEWQTADGTVVSVACADNSFTVVLNQGGHPSSYHTKSTPFGFSDTHWWGADHFTPCFHVAGLRAVVHFKPSSDAAYTGELMNVGFRDDLPQTKIAAQPAASAKN
jgi:Tfp pilus assembly protein PilF